MYQRSVAARNEVGNKYGFVAYHPTQGSWELRKAENIKDKLKLLLSVFVSWTLKTVLSVFSSCYKYIHIVWPIFSALLHLCPLLWSLGNTLFQSYRLCLSMWFSIHNVAAYCRLLRTQIMNGAVFCFSRAASFFSTQSKSRSGRNSQRLNSMIMRFLIIPLGWGRQCKSAQFLPSHRVVLTECVINCYCSFICTNQWICNWVPPGDSLTTDRRQRKKSFHANKKISSSGFCCCFHLARQKDLS